MQKKEQQKKTNSFMNIVKLIKPFYTDWSEHVSQKTLFSKADWIKKTSYWKK